MKTFCCSRHLFITVKSYSIHSTFLMLTLCTDPCQWCPQFSCPGQPHWEGTYFYLSSLPLKCQHTFRPHCKIDVIESHAKSFNSYFGPSLPWTPLIHARFLLETTTTLSFSSFRFTKAAVIFDGIVVQWEVIVGTQIRISCGGHIDAMSMPIPQFATSGVLTPGLLWIIWIVKLCFNILNES